MAEVQAELSSFFDGGELTRDALAEWNDRVHASSRTLQQFSTLADEYRSRTDRGNGEELRLGVALLLLGRYSDALEYFGKATDNRVRRFFGAQAAAALGRFEQAIADYERAAARGWDQFEADMETAALHVRAGDVVAARKLLSRHANAGKDKSSWYYVDAVIREYEGDYTGALEAYERALNLDPDDPRTMFRCAYLYDLHGEDGLAIDLYKRLAHQPAAHVNALINLSVLYEDRGEFGEAVGCLQRVLTTYPNHVRARLFLKDVESSRGMVIDEEIAKRPDGATRLLDQPITDFELSVRSRNCLKKMNINTLGDLLRISEAELLAYKNFGETSLNEIKALLAARGLRLGQALDELEGPPVAPPPAAPPVNVPPGSEAALSKSVSELELSVRARKCLQRLNITSIGELISKTEQDLLAIRNFGVTSLNEIKQRLGDLGLQLASGPAPQ